ncbi:MAG: NAD(P)/FAD-dependent oxidoreductase [Congregibacter sp.]
MQDIHDVAIIGAGLSGVGAACHLRQQCPDRRVVILEAREVSGGTWDLFRYPGIRSDSDMHTLGYSFKPWKESKAIADGPSILNYVRETAAEYGVEALIRYQHRVVAANWNSQEQLWDLTVETPDGEIACRSRFVLMAGGYYRYDKGYQPEFPGREDFAGDFLHPQLWPEKLNYEGKRVVIIGSGATAVTLVPAMAQTAQEVVMLQRSPTWIVSRPASDWIANTLRAVLPNAWAYAAARWKNTRMQSWVYRRTRRKPEKIRKMLLDGVTKELGKDADLEHFTPSYNPWDQRLCLVPDGDFFAAMRARKARVVTAHIDRIVPDGIRLESGELLEADIIVSATGLEMEVMGGAAVSVDGEPFDFPASWSYRGMMCSGLPNFVSIFGYINASWTLRADLVNSWFCGLLKHMRYTDAAVVTPELEEGLPEMPPRPYIDDFSAGYMQRAMHRFPRQGNRDPWINSQNYLLEKQQFAQMNYLEDALKYSPAIVAGEGARRAA